MRQDGASYSETIGWNVADMEDMSILDWPRELNVSQTAAKFSLASPEPKKGSATQWGQATSPTSASTYSTTCLAAICLPSLTPSKAFYRAQFSEDDKTDLIL